MGAPAPTGVLLCGTCNDDAYIPVVLASCTVQPSSAKLAGKPHRRDLQADLKCAVQLPLASLIRPPGRWLYIPVVLASCTVLPSSTKLAGKPHRRDVQAYLQCAVQLPLASSTRPPGRWLYIPVVLASCTVQTI